MRSSRSAPAILAVVALGALGMPPLLGPAGATPSGETSITVYLKPADGAALTRLAKAGFTDRARRLAALERALPSAAAHRAAATSPNPFAFKRNLRQRDSASSNTGSTQRLTVPRIRRTPLRRSAAHTAAQQ